MDNKTYKIVLGAILGVIWILMCTSCYLLGVAHGRSEAALVSDNLGRKELRSTVVDKDNIDDVSAGLEGRRNGPQSYEVIMNTEWEFDEDGIRSLNAYVENSRDNHNTVYFTIILEKEPDKIIYRSPEMPVGSKLTDIKLNGAIPKGRSKGIVTYSLLDDRGKASGEVKAGVTLIRGE